MSEQITSFRSIIELWPSREAMAVDLGAGLGAWAVSKWWQRNNIPAEWWLALLESKKAIKGGVSAELLTALAARETCEARA